jgi:hypothetical protein
MAINLETILGGNIGDLFSKIVGTFKLSPEKAAELEQAKEANSVALQKMQSDLDAKAQDILATEVESAASIIKIEAQSQSWLPRNVRPLLLLCWGAAITFNALVPVIARYWFPGLQPLQLDPWVYKLTAIGYTGYVGFRSVEKLMDKDS